ncbi:MAG: DNA-binding protein [Sterolibacterium sp.]
MKTAEEVCTEFRRKGITVTGWAKKHGFAVQAVRRVLRGRAKCYYGNAHKIAVLLGVKEGEIANE